MISINEVEETRVLLGEVNLIFLNGSSQKKLNEGHGSLHDAEFADRCYQV